MIGQYSASKQLRADYPVTQQHIPEEVNPQKQLNWKISANVVLQLLELFYQNNYAKRDESQTTVNVYCLLKESMLKRRDMVY
jgi:hypothetical protein